MTSTEASACLIPDCHFLNQVLNGLHIYAVLIYFIILKSAKQGFLPKSWERQMTTFCVETHNAHPALFVHTSSHHLLKKCWQYGAAFVKMRELVQGAFKEREQSMMPAVCCSLCHHWVNYNVCTASANKEAVLLTIFLLLWLLECHFAYSSPASWSSMGYLSIYQL